MTVQSSGKGSADRRSKLIGSMREDLLNAASEGRKVTYGRLMKKFGLSRGRSLSAAIGEVDRAETLSGSPGFAAIVVRRDTGFPGGGYFCDPALPKSVRRPSDRSTDPRLSSRERGYVTGEQRKIWRHYASKGGRARASPLDPEVP